MSQKLDPSPSKTDPDVCEDSREDQLSPDGPERLKQQQLVCGEALHPDEMSPFTAELLTESGETSYRFRCPGPGVFRCALTGLVFVMSQEAELRYNIVPWDESLLHQLAGWLQGRCLTSSVQRMEQSVSSTSPTVTPRKRCLLTACCLSSTSLMMG
ncbi:hypothetical protein FQN60_004507 [Etheostoma spectabile]|uniref:FIIND domain-containing protein n=1 Tax=Etheostoma spectabile TaxID=54343 RepID=A0A5J5C8V6_9PERO|nr:hypothetical protein FQN60_004507 [Etheostoma spectabile]